MQDFREYPFLLPEEPVTRLDLFLAIIQPPNTSPFQARFIEKYGQLPADAVETLLAVGRKEYISLERLDPVQAAQKYIFGKVTFRNEADKPFYIRWYAQFLYFFLDRMTVCPKSYRKLYTEEQWVVYSKFRRMQTYFIQLVRHITHYLTGPNPDRLGLSSHFPQKEFQKVEACSNLWYKEPAPDNKNGLIPFSLQPDEDRKWGWQNLQKKLLSAVRAMIDAIPSQERPSRLVEVEFDDGTKHEVVAAPSNSPRAEGLPEASSSDPQADDLPEASSSDPQADDLPEASSSDPQADDLPKASSAWRKVREKLPSVRHNRLHRQLACK